MRAAAFEALQRFIAGNELAFIFIRIPNNHNRDVGLLCEAGGRFRIVACFPAHGRFLADEGFNPLKRRYGVRRVHLGGAMVPEIFEVGEAAEHRYAQVAPLQRQGAFVL